MELLKKQLLFIAVSNVLVQSIDGNEEPVDNADMKLNRKCIDMLAKLAKEGELKYVGVIVNHITDDELDAGKFNVAIRAMSDLAESQIRTKDKAVVFLYGCATSDKDETNKMPATGMLDGVLTACSKAFKARFANEQMGCIGNDLETETAKNFGIEFMSFNEAYNQLFPAEQ